jgi:hypothetical protein
MFMDISNFTTISWWYRERETLEDWLDKLFINFNYNEKKNYKARGELFSKLWRLCGESVNGSHSNAWTVCFTSKWFFDHLSYIHQTVTECASQPISTTICEGGFSKQNWMKNDLKSKLRLKTLDPLRQSSMCKNEIHSEGLITHFYIWSGMKNHRVLTLKI